MKIYFKVLILFAVFFTFAIFQGCWEKQENYCSYCEILDFEIQKLWSENDTVKIKDFGFALNGFNYLNCTEKICTNLRNITKAYANNPTYFFDGEIKSINIYKYDIATKSDILFNNNFMLFSYENNKFINLSNINFPIKVQKELHFHLENINYLDSIDLHRFTIIYEEIDGTKITKVLPEVYISPN
jgi:hypothetical protein